MNLNLHPKTTGATIGGAFAALIIGLFGSHLTPVEQSAITIILPFLGGYLPASPAS